MKFKHREKRVIVLSFESENHPFTSDGLKMSLLHVNLMSESFHAYVETVASIHAATVSKVFSDCVGRESGLPAFRQPARVVQGSAAVDMEKFLDRRPIMRDVVHAG